MARTEAPYVEADRSLGPTPRASKFNKRLGVAGHEHMNGGQGTEQVDIIPELRAIMEGAEVEIDRSYNPEIGGPEALSESLVGWSDRNLGIAGHPDTTFAVQNVGRGLMERFAHVRAQEFRSADYIANNTKRPAILVQADSWSITYSIFKKAGFDIIEYEVDPDDPVGSYERALEEASQDHTIAATAFNTPHNASGYTYNTEQMKQIKAIADRHNISEPATKMSLFIDMPYYAACDKAENSEADNLRAYLESGLEGVFDPADFDPESEHEVVTPVAIGLSGSKAMRTAKNGFGWTLVTKDLAPETRASINENGMGISFSPSFYHNMTIALSEENDHLWHKQFDMDRQKFEENRQMLIQVFGESVIPGSKNLVGLVQFPDVFERDVMCHDGQVRRIRAAEDGGVEDVLEIIGNGTPDEDGVVLVDGSRAKGVIRLYDDTQPLTPQFRIAMAKTQDEFAELAQRTRRILSYIEDQPKYEPGGIAA